jgi:hypothetical protein
VLHLRRHLPLSGLLRSESRSGVALLVWGFADGLKQKGARRRRV